MTRYPSTYVTTDIVTVRKSESGKKEILLIQRKHDPFKDAWALPGGFFDSADQNIEAGALRELKEETDLDVDLNDLRLIGIFSEKGRDPREMNSNDICRVVSAAFIVHLPENHKQPSAQDDAKSLRFFPIDQLPDLAFDHAEIIGAANLR